MRCLSGQDQMQLISVKSRIASLKDTIACTGFKFTSNEIIFWLHVLDVFEVNMDSTGVNIY